MMIFDRFPTREAAEKFAAATKRDFALDGEVRDERDDTIDMFPFALDGPVAYIDRPEHADDYSDVDKAIAIEARVAASVEAYGGSYAGT